MRDESRLLEVLNRESSLDPDDIRNGNGVRALEAFLDRLVEEPCCDEQGEERTDPDEPRPERSRAVGRLIGLERPPDHLGGGGRVDRPLAGEHHRRGLGRLGGDAAAARDRLQVGVHRGSRLVAVGGLLGEGANDDEVEVVRDVGAELGGRRRRLGEVLHRDLDGAVPGERHLAGEQLEEDDPRGVEVRRLVDRSAARLLGGEVVRRADDRAFLRHLTRAGARDAEVRDLDDALGVDDDVVRLDVAVDDAVAMCISQCGEDLPGVRDRDGNGAEAARADQFLERSALDVLHDDEVGALGLAAIEDRDDVRMRQTGGVGRLATEALDELLVVRVAPVQHLHRNAAAELLILGEVHVGHAPAAELPCDAVAPREEGAGEGVLGRHLCKDRPRG